MAAADVTTTVDLWATTIGTLAELSLRDRTSVLHEELVFPVVILPADLLALITRARDNSRRLGKISTRDKMGLDSELAAIMDRSLEMGDKVVAADKERHTPLN